MRAHLLLLALVACNPYDKDLGPTPYFCGPTEPRCPSGYNCVDDPSNGSEVCIASSDSISNDFDCADDSAMEPNNSLMESSTTPVDGTKMFTLDELAICPARDRDVFKIDIGTTNENVELLVTYESTGAVLGAAILNTGGVPIATSQPVDGSPGTVRAYTQNLASGIYYASVYGPTTGLPAQNNYTLTINITGP